MLKLNQALTHLQTVDPVLAGLITRFGKLNYRPPRDRFANLVSTIIGQQLSAQAADTIYGRFLKLFPHGVYSPDHILQLDDAVIRKVGTSWAKIRSLKDLAQKMSVGTLDLSRLDALSDEGVISYLTQVKGIGRWTADMKLMFTLHRPDILPLADVGIQNAFVLHYGLKRSHKSLPDQMIKIAAPWRPWRTVACWYLWKSLDNQ